MNEQWRTNMREKLDGHRQAAPLLSWDEVERRAAAAEKSAKVAAWGRRAMAAAAMVIFLCGVAATLLLLNDGQNAQQVANLERHYAPQHNTTKPADNGTNAVAHNINAEKGTRTANTAGSDNTQYYYAKDNRNIVNQETNLYAAVPANNQQKAGQPQANIETTTDTQQSITDYTSKNSTDKAPLGLQTTRTQPNRTESLPAKLPRNTAKPTRAGGAWMAKAYVSAQTTARCNAPCWQRRTPMAHLSMRRYATASMCGLRTHRQLWKQRLTTGNRLGWVRPCAMR